MTLIQEPWDLYDPLLLVQTFCTYRSPDQQRAADKDHVIFWFFLFLMKKSTVGVWGTDTFIIKLFCLIETVEC